MSGLDEPRRTEVRLAVVPEDTDVAIEAFEAFSLDESPDEERSIHFFDTRELVLFEQGIIVRTRQNLGRGHDDATLEIRGPAAATVARRFETHVDGAAKLEGDQSAGQAMVPAFSLTYPHDREAIFAVLKGRRPLGSLFGEQKDLLPELFGQTATSITVFGPVHATSWKLKLPGFEGQITIELWQAGSINLIELSDMKDSADAEAFGERLLERFRELGLRPLHDSKTRAALVNAPSRPLK